MNHRIPQSTHKILASFKLYEFHLTAQLTLRGGLSLNTLKATVNSCETATYDFAQSVEIEGPL